MPLLRINLPHARLGRVNTHFIAHDNNTMRRAVGLTEEVSQTKRGKYGDDEEIVPFVLRISLREPQTLDEMIQEEASKVDSLYRHAALSAETDWSAAMMGSDPSCSEGYSGLAERSSDSSRSSASCSFAPAWHSFSSDGSLSAAALEDSCIEAAKEWQAQRLCAEATTLNEHTTDVEVGPGIVRQFQSLSVLSAASGVEEPQVDPEVKLQRARSLAILEGDLIAPRDHDYGNAFPLFKSYFRMYRRQFISRKETLAYAHAHGRAYAADPPISEDMIPGSSAEWMRAHLWRSMPPQKRHLLFEWTPELQALLLELEYVTEGRAVVCHVVKARSLNACTPKEFKEVMFRMEERGWKDMIWVMEQEGNFPSRFDGVWSLERGAYEVILR